jgi:adenylate cyclase
MDVQDTSDVAPDPAKVQSAVDWLVEGALSVQQPQDVLGGLCERLHAAGLDLHRVAVFVRTLHPDIMGRRFIWQPGRPVDVGEAPISTLSTDTYVRSSVAHVMHTGESIRRRLERADCPDDFNILTELRAQGVTDYVAQALRFTTADVHAATWSTVRPGGFRDADLAALEAIRLPLARLAEIYALRRVAVTLLSTYVGRDAGGRVLAGAIRRGDVETLRAVIWLADLAGFSELSNNLPGDEVVQLLNAFYDCQVPAIEAHGGEVLKFIGDGLLAIFPVRTGAEAACRAALDAAAETHRALNERNAGSHGGTVLRDRLALHIGDVAYGNIGASRRLDFTAIGPAVNLTARLEALAGRLDRSMLVSAEFAAFCADEVQRVGRYALKGFEGRRAVYAPKPPVSGA